MPPAGFEPAVQASDRQQALSSDRSDTGIRPLPPPPWRYVPRSLTFTTLSDFSTGKICTVVTVSDSRSTSSLQNGGPGYPAWGTLPVALQAPAQLLESSDHTKAGIHSVWPYLLHFREILSTGALSVMSMHGFECYRRIL